MEIFLFKKAPYIKLLTWYFGTLWSMPVELLAIVIVFSFVTAIAAAYAPAKHIQYVNYRNNQ